MAYHKSLAGIGAVSAIPSGANPTPIDLAVISAISYDVKEEDVDLEGTGMDVLDSFPSKRTLTGKIEVSEWSAKLLAMATGGVTTSTGQKIGATQSAAIPTTPFQVTVTQSATWDTDLVVVDLTAGKQLTRVASAPTTGQYSVAAGVYTFAAADTGHTVFIRYRYAAAALGVQAKISASLAGAASPKFQLHYYNGTAGKDSGIYVPSARIPGLSAAFKRDGWVATSLEFKATLDSNNDLFYSWSPE